VGVGVTVGVGVIVGVAVTVGVGVRVGVGVGVLVGVGVATMNVAVVSVAEAGITKEQLPPPLHWVPDHALNAQPGCPVGVRDTVVPLGTL
jgi:hypothetical protein